MLSLILEKTRHFLHHKIFDQTLIVEFEILLKLLKEPKTKSVFSLFIWGKLSGIDKEFNGEIISAKGIKIGYLPQEPELDPSKNVYDNVCLLRL